MIANHSFEQPPLSGLPQISSKLAFMAARVHTAPALRLQETGRLWRWICAPLDEDGSAKKPPLDMSFVSGYVGSVPLAFCLSLHDWGVLDERLALPNGRIPTDIQSAIQRMALYDAIEAFHRFFSRTLQLDSTTNLQTLQRLQHPVGVVFSVTLPDGAVAQGTCFSTVQAWSEWLEGSTFTSLHEQWPAPPVLGGQHTSSAHIELSILAGRIVLSCDSVSHLVAGDMLRLWGQLRLSAASPAAASPMALILKCGTLSARGHCDKQGDIILDQNFTEGADLAPVQTRHSADHLLTPADALSGPLECMVEFEVARLAMPLQKVISLSAGELIPLNNPLNQGEVTLLTAGKPFAKGRLVTVGDELAVVVTQVGGA